MREQFLLDLHHVRRRKIDLVDGDDDRHARVLRVRNRFDRLRHHRVVRGDDDHDDVRDLRAARTHGGECFMARRVEEGDLLAARRRDVIRADVLRDAAGFARDDVRLADEVEQRRLAVVDVTHDRDDRRTRSGASPARRRRSRPRRGVLLFLLRVESELARDQFDLVEVEALIDGDHQAEVLERERDDLCGRHLEDVGEFADRDELVDADELLLDLGRGGAHRFDFFARAVVAGAAALGARPAHLAHRARDVRRHRLLIHLAALALLATPADGAGASHPARAAASAAAAAGTAIVATRHAAAAAGTRRGGRDRTRRERHSARDGTRARCARHDRTRTRTVGRGVRALRRRMRCARRSGGAGGAAERRAARRTRCLRAPTARRALPARLSRPARPERPAPASRRRSPSFFGASAATTFSTTGAAASAISSAVGSGAARRRRVPGLAWVPAPAPAQARPLPFPWLQSWPWAWRAHRSPEPGSPVQPRIRRRRRCDGGARARRTAPRPLRRARAFRAPSVRGRAPPCCR